MSYFAFGYGLEGPNWTTSIYNWLVKDKWCNVVCVAKILMPPRDHIISGNDGVYEMSENTLSGIKYVIATLEDDEWSGDTNLLVIGNCSGHLFFFVWPNLSCAHCWYVRKLNDMKLENFMVICT